MSTHPCQERTAAMLYHNHLTRKLSSDSQLLGHKENWSTLVSVMTAPEGFGEEMWIDAYPATLIALRLCGAQVRCEWGARKSLTSGPGQQFAFHLKGTPNHFIAEGKVRFAVIHLPEVMFDRAAEVLRPRMSIGTTLRPDLIFVPDIELERRLRSCVEASLRDPTALEMEARSLLIVEHILVRHHGFGPPAGVCERGGLAPWQVRRTREYLNEHLADDISIADLATQVRLSAFHFARAFKKSVGIPPHAYHRQLRLREAQRLLVESRMAITDIAAKVGYNVPQTLARVFQQQLGVSPTAYRRENP